MEKIELFAHYSEVYPFSSFEIICFEVFDLINTCSIWTLIVSAFVSSTETHLNLIDKFRDLRLGV